MYFTFAQLKITHPVCRGDKSIQKQPSMTRKNTKGMKEEKQNTVNPNKTIIKGHLNFWDADVTDIFKTVGFGVREMLHHCSYAQGMRGKFQEGTLLRLRSPRACLSHCGCYHSAANIKTAPHSILKKIYSTHT